LTTPPERTSRQRGRPGWRGLRREGEGLLGIAVIWPPLDDAGNSVRAQRAIADISNALGGNPCTATVSRGSM
jgi:hypothetical protein